MFPTALSGCLTDGQNVPSSRWLRCSTREWTTASGMYRIGCTVARPVATDSLRRARSVTVD